MRYRVTAAAILIAFFGRGHAEESALKDDKDRESYSAGFQIGSNFKRQSVDVKPEMFLKGLQDAIAGKTPAMTQEEITKALTGMQQRATAAQQQQRKEAGEKNLAAGKAFLDENGKKPGVVTLPSGLQYILSSEGKGPKPKATDTVTVHYRGTLIDGTEFDSSYKRNEPAKFRLDQVVKGWTEGLQQMPQGSKGQLFIPPSLAYGDRGAGPIGPNSTLIFDIELIGIDQGEKKSEPEKKAEPAKKSGAKKK